MFGILAVGTGWAWHRYGGDPSNYLRDMTTLHLWFHPMFVSNPYPAAEGFVVVVVAGAVFAWGKRKKHWLSPSKKPKASALHGTAGWRTSKI